MRTIGLAIAIALVAACGDHDDRRATNRQSSSPAVARPDALVIDTDASSDAAPVPPPIANPGAVYLIADGVFRIDGAGPTVALEREDELLSHSTLDRDGRLWIAHESGDSVRVHGRKTQVVGLGGDIVELASAIDGGVWAIADIRDQGRLFRVDAMLGVRGIKQPIGESGDPIDLMSGSIVDAGDVLWIAGRFGLLRYTIATRTWELVRSGWLRSLIRGSDGVLWMLDSEKRAVLGLDGTTWIELAYPTGDASPQSMASTPDGGVITLFKRTASVGWLAGFRRTGGEAAWNRPRIGSLKTVWSLLAVDHAGRIWVGDRGGLAVLDANGRSLAAFANATIPGVVGSMIYSVHVVGDGPASLPAPMPIATGAIRGRLINKDGRAAAGTQLQLCVGECDDGAPLLTIMADTEGRFTVDDVTITDYPTAHPVGTHYTMGTSFALQRRGDARGFSCCLELEPGKTLDLGTLILDVDPGVP